jgi:hypothetical protein
MTQRLMSETDWKNALLKTDALNDFPTEVVTIVSQYLA